MLQRNFPILPALSATFATFDEGEAMKIVAGNVRQLRLIVRAALVSYVEEDLVDNIYEHSYFTKAMVL